MMMCLWSTFTSLQPTKILNCTSTERSSLLKLISSDPGTSQALRVNSTHCLQLCPAYHLSSLLGSRLAKKKGTQQCQGDNAFWGWGYISKIHSSSVTMPTRNWGSFILWKEWLLESIELCHCSSVIIVYLLCHSLKSLS
jgi:hypothetical protein